MAFSVQDFHDLIRILDERPEWRADLRRLVLTDELLALPQLVQELVEAHRQAEVRLSRVEEHIAALAEAQRRFEERLTFVEERLSGVEERLSGVEERLARVEEHIEALARAQRYTEERVAALEERMEERFAGVELDLAELKGYQLEHRYHARPFAYFSDILLRARTVSDEELSDLLSAALEQGKLTEEETQELAVSDVIVHGVRREDKAPVYVVAEVSWGVGPSNIKRAARRAGLLAKLGTPTIPVAAGRRVTDAVRQEAEQMGVRLVTDGRSLS